MKTYAYGFPKLGQHREFKRMVEGFWKESLGEKDLIEGISNIQKHNTDVYRKNIDSFPDGEVSFYDFMLDTAVLFGVYAPQNMKEYYELCRGANALEMTKWFNTNYHYLVPDFQGFINAPFKLNKDHAALKLKQGDFPQLIGPFTFLKLSKGIPKEFFRPFFLSLVDSYKAFIKGHKNIQIDEPAFCMDLSQQEIELITEGYQRLAGTGAAVTLMTYYGPIDFMKELLSLPVSAIGIDFVRGQANLEYISQNGFPDDKVLIAGLVDGRNIWKNDVQTSIGRLNKLSAKVKHLVVSNAAPLYHLPVSICLEEKIDARLKDRLAFAKEKLAEIRLIADGFEGKTVPALAGIGDYGKNANVQKRIKDLQEADFIKPVSLQERRKIHEQQLKLPLFPTTTIGSFPQTEEVRLKRGAWIKGELSAVDYKEYVEGQIDRLVQFQEDLGLDVFVHGEYERTDMVEFFAQKLDGIATTQHGWVISYGTRAYRPPVIFGDVSRPRPMTVDEIRYAQTKTKKPVKGMLTGAVTIIAWSFSREDIPTRDVAYQISLALKDEILDYEKAGISIVQVDEAAFREKAPIKKAEWPAYFEWAVRSFNLATNTDPGTQVHTHMCYSEFGEIIDHINAMDFDVISIEASRSKGDIIGFFENVDFQRQIGLGVWDIHSPSVPSVDKMVGTVKRSLQKIPKENFWLNPDCGLKTRQWPEVKEALAYMVSAAQTLRRNQ